MAAFLLPYADAYGLFRAPHSHNPTRYSHIGELAFHFYAHIGADPKVFQPHMSKLLWFQTFFPWHLKKRAHHQADSIIQSNPLIVRVHSLRLAPSVTGVAVASQILCISTTLNKRKASLFGSCINYSLLLRLSSIFYLFLHKSIHNILIGCQLLRIIEL